VSKIAMEFLMSKLECRGIKTEVTEDTYHDEPFLQITGLAEEEGRRVVAGLLGLEIDELPPGYIRVNLGVMVQLMARFMVDEAELAENRRRKAWCD